ncbi:MAG: metalloregulator ArsR/SmtB family transcription factor [Aeromicrobium sp.]|uniref:ArsR/SmtB family transcription factor n=1 Tax=Aeromicrobium sp. TaxID=1871063 RepID=UPI003C61A90E
MTTDQVFKALADGTRRELLDRLREQDGQTLGELCERLIMTRQSVTQHLDILAAANLVSVVRRGRERVHMLNLTPIHEMQERWISAFDRPRLTALSVVKRHAEEIAMSESSTIPTYVHVTYIRATAAQVWEALTDADLTAQYWNHRNVSDWVPGSAWEHLPLDGGGPDIVGSVIESNRPRRLAITFSGPDGEQPPGGPSVVTFDIDAHDALVRLTVTHENVPDAGMYAGISKGWPAVVANLKSMLETGEVLPPSLWEHMTKGESADA